MKTAIRFAASIVLSVITLATYSQTVVVSTITFDTTVTGTGSMYPPYEFSFPKFQSSLGTLTEVRVSSVLTWQYGFTMESTDNSAKTARVKILRSDEINSNALLSPITYNYTSPQVNYNLGAADGVTGSGPDFRSVPPVFYANSDTVINRTLYNTADFMGAGSVNFQYSTDVGYSVSGATLQFFGQATDQIKMSVKYVYSNNVFLASDITSFSAVKKDGAVNLTWRNANERSERTYELMKSADGVHFSIVKKFNAAPDGNDIGNYAFRYVPENNENGKLYFQVKQVETRGATKFSAVRTVDIENTLSKGIRLFPNPAKGGEVTILFNDGVPGDYDVQLFNIKGQVVKQLQVSNVQQVKMNLGSQLRSGDYFVMALNKRTGLRSVERLAVK